MALKSITLQLPDELYDSVQEAAEASDRSLEAILVESLDVLFHRPSPTEDFDNVLAALATYTDAQLWAVVYRRLTWNEALHLRELSTKNKHDLLNDAEQRELNDLLDLVDRDMVLRSEALLLLKQRGYDIATYLKTGS